MTVPAAISFRVPGEPVAFARAGSNGKRRFTPPRQEAWKRSCGFLASVAMRGCAVLSGPVHLDVVAVFPFPARWSKARRARTTWHTSTPDGDNVAKLVADSLKGIAWADDAAVARWSIEKVHGVSPEVVVTITPLVDDGPP